MIIEIVAAATGTYVKAIKIINLRGYDFLSMLR